MPYNHLPQFYVVWNPTARVPMVQHPTVDLAVAEAERLAVSNPSYVFYVLKAISVSRCKGVVTEHL